MKFLLYLSLLALIFISFGTSSNVNEIIDIEDKNLECPNTNTNISRSYLGGGTTLQGAPVFCGSFKGFNVDNACQIYKYISGNESSPVFGWIDFATLSNGRRFHSINTFNSSIFVFGGTDKSFNALDTVEIISLDGMVKNGPKLPTTLFDLCSVVLDENFVLLTGGMVDSRYMLILKSL